MFCRFVAALSLLLGTLLLEQLQTPEALSLGRDAEAGNLLCSALSAREASMVGTAGRFSKDILLFTPESSPLPVPIAPKDHVGKTL